MSQIRTIDTDRLSEKTIGMSEKLIDVRPADAFNGWRLGGEPRGGHIRGAVSFPAEWTEYIDWIEIAQKKKIEPGQPLILYGYDRDITEKAAAQFLEAGYRSVTAYHNFKDEWSTDSDLPLDKLRGFQRLVPAQWVKALTCGEKVPEPPSGDFVICHSHYRNRGAYEEGHIPGAVALDTNALESSATWNLRKPAELREALKAHGITSGRTAILYGRFSSPGKDDPFPGSSAGHLGAMRTAFILLYAGVRDVRVINGGLQSWIGAGHETTTEETPPRPAEFGSEIPGRPDLAVDMEQAKRILSSDDQNLVCVRSRDEYYGRVSGYNYIAKKGRIPGAVFAECGSDAYHMENYRNPDHTCRQYDEIERMWARSGILPDRHNSFYCGTGWRAGEAFFNAWIMGWPRISVFDGGWFEWSSDERNPYETGE